MIDSKQTFPQNLPYMQPAKLSSEPSEHQDAHSKALMARIQDLERNLAELTALLAEDSGLQEAYAQLQQENEQLRALLTNQPTSGGQEELQAHNQFLKENLLKQNEEMEELYRQLQQARNSQSRLQERGHSELLESKVQQLNDEISNLLVKIQELVDENNAQQEAMHQLPTLQNALSEAEARTKEMQVENQILKEEIRSMEDLYIKQIERLKQEAEENRNSQRTHSRPGQIRVNTERGEERAQLERQLASLRTQVAARNEELLEYRQEEAQLRRKWEERLASSEAQTSSLNEELSKLRGRLRQQEDKCSEYEFVLHQQQKDRERLAFYKSSYTDSETLRSTIVRLEAEKEQLLLRTERLKAELSQRKFDLPLSLAAEKNEMTTFMQVQVEEELQKSKRLNKQLKGSIGRYEQDYRQLRKEYEQLLLQKVKAAEIITAHQLELQKHKAIYEEVVARCNATAADYKQLEKKLLVLQSERTSRANAQYDKENAQLIQLENSTLRQEIAALKEQIAKIHSHSQFDGQAKRREREILQELQMYRQKYLRELEKGKREQELQNTVADLEGKLVRVNKVLNQKLKELEHAQNRQVELTQEANAAYACGKADFEHFGLRHHPEIKKLQAELLATQRQLMENEHAFKTQISSLEDELKACRLENQHHRAKIDQLLLQVNRQRNSFDYSKLTRSLQLAELKEKEMQRELNHKENLLEELRGQLKQLQSRERTKVETSLVFQQEKENLEKQIRQQEAGIQSLIDCLNALEPSSRSQDPIKKAIRLLTKTAANGRSSLNDGQRRDSISSRQSENSRYEELARKKAFIAEQFKHSEQFLIVKTEERKETKEKGILRRLQQNWGL